MRNIRIGEWLHEPMTPLFQTWLLALLEDGYLRVGRQLAGTAIPFPHASINGWYYTPGWADCWASPTAPPPDRRTAAPWFLLSGLKPALDLQSATPLLGSTFAAGVPPGARRRP